MNLMKRQQEASDDTAPRVLIQGAMGAGKSTVLAAKAASAKSACVVTRNSQAFEQTFGAAFGRDWTYMHSRRRWARGDRFVDIVHWDNREQIRGMRYDVLCFDGIMPGDDEEWGPARALNPGGQIYVATRDKWSVHDLSLDMQ